MNKFDFIEIGTSDFDTLCEQADENTKGISVEPLPYYVARLPKRKNVIVTTAAIVPEHRRATVPIYWVHPDEIKKHNLPDWLRGCNRIGGLHLQHMNPSIAPLVRKDDIEAISLQHLCSLYQVEQVTFLKLDTEGMDADILLDYAKCLTVKPTTLPFPALIQFESNCLTHQTAIDEVKNTYRALGYYAVRKHDDTLLIRKDQ